MKFCFYYSGDLLCAQKGYKTEKMDPFKTKKKEKSKIKWFKSSPSPPHSLYLLYTNFSLTLAFHLAFRLTSIIDFLIELSAGAKAISASGSLLSVREIINYSSGHPCLINQSCSWQK